ncbi:MAG: hypothetical protein KA085_00885 [Phenylobacterium sp.]|uniref:hypothetical protein n=1 Tax=Phenylobacterium sp. TaxID=1871053 RepID=UPI001B5EB57A|nr:hypothetical protein [Phenylobacterium sp.]MBP7814651.1 hypothetical protein [Phenylobacterium sp.]
MAYDYFSMTLGRERTAQKALSDHLRGAMGSELVAVFAPVLGFASNTALVLVKGEGGAGAAGSAPGVLASEHHSLTPTLRPMDDAPPLAGGIYVHNWFTIDGDAVDEFVGLSGEAWPDFETRFEAKIFGLFLAAESAADRADGARRLLLMTRYRDLGEWQTSRDPTSAAMQVFARRRQLTRVSLARACQLIS